MLDYSDKKLIKYIIEFINSNDKFKNLFSHHKQIYPIEILLEGILYKLKTGIAYKNIIKKKITNYRK